jgi:hypothetical protein
MSRYAHYTIVFERIGRKYDVPELDLTVDEEDDDVITADVIAEAVYRYARKHLASREVEVVVELDEEPNAGGKGWLIVGGFRAAGDFTIKPVG